MNAPTFSLNINDIYGVSAYLDSENVRLKFRCPMSIDSWHLLLKNIDEMINGDMSNWMFDLTELEYPGSTDMGMWVTCSTRIKLIMGRIEFLVKKKSHVHTLLKVTRLIEILDVVLTD